jgi:ketosteroid isomerase-like protein
MIMKKSDHILPLLFLSFISLTISCTDTPRAETTSPREAATDNQQNEASMIATMKKHLHAVSNKNLEDLKRTMSPSGKMQLILPGTEILQSVDSFMQYHEEWFRDTSWTFETKILSTEVDQQLGTAVTEVTYREPERDGRPYWNRMIVTYSLQKEDGQWYVIQDHASSIEKSTDQ